jgi:hypothetical protein
MNRTMIAITLLAGCATTARPPQTPNGTALELAARRAQMIGWLHDYEVAGVYPTDAFGRPLSVFVDDKGVRCPMAELIHKSGRDDLVEAVHREANGVRLADVHEGPLYNWMLASGLTQEEIALVQGAANIDFTWMQEQPMNLQLAQGTAEVRGKLETAEMALRQGTAHGLEVALARLPAKQAPEQLAMSPVHDKAVPKSAIPAPVAPAPMPAVVLQRRGYRGQLGGISIQ